MKALIEFLAHYCHVALFLLLEGTALLLLLRSGTYQMSVWFSAASTVAGHVHQWESRLLAQLTLAAENEALTRRNVQLEHQLEQLRTQIAGLTHDSTHTERLMAATLDTLQLIAARVVHNEVHMRDNYIAIDRGEADGVHPEMGVVSGRSVVGIVCLTSRHHSLVMPVLNSKSSISCRLRHTNYFGYLHWERGDTRYATLDDVPRHAVVKEGDVVETSGLSSVFPPGIFVGRVEKIMDSDDALSYQLRVHLGTDMSTLCNVNVIVPPASSHEVTALRDSVSTLQKKKK